MLRRFVLAHFCREMFTVLSIFSVEVQGLHYSVEEVDFLLTSRFLVDLTSPMEAYARLYVMNPARLDLHVTTGLVTLHKLCVKPTGLGG